MTHSSTEPPASDSSQNLYSLLGNMISILTKAIDTLPPWQRIGGFALVIAVIPVTLAIYFLSSDPKKLFFLSIIFLVWISSMLFVVYAFTKLHRQSKKKLDERIHENMQLDELRNELIDKVDDSYKSILEVESRLGKINNQVGELLRLHPDLKTEITTLKDSVDPLIRYISEKKSSYNSFIQMMNGTEGMRRSTGTAIEVLKELPELPSQPR